MSPPVGIIDKGLTRFPRVSGDEPYHPQGRARALWFSPRERG